VAVGEKKVVTFPPMPPDGVPRPGSALPRLILRCRPHPPGIPCPAIRCESDADCPRLLGAPCVHCVGGLCMSNHPCLQDRKLADPHLAAELGMRPLPA
jgi:hypothetical protein